MPSEYYIRLAAQGLRFPIAADLLLAEQQDPEVVRCDGEKLGRLVELTARRFSTPLAVPLMDLRLEKADLLRALGLPEAEADAFHFAEPPDHQILARLEALFDSPFAARNRAHIDSVRYISECTDLWPVGMAIGPFSLATKLLADPITPIALAGMGLTGGDDPAVLLMERCLALAEWAVARSVCAQIRAGARAMLICEPAANVVYISPKQIAAGADIFERFVIQPHLRLKQRLEEAGVDLIFHDCGRLTLEMIRLIAHRLHPAVLSLGSSEKLWEVAAVVPKDIVLYGNLPTKSFYSDAVMPVKEVERLTAELIENMRRTGHPHILGSECDVLYVPEAAEKIWRKLRAMLEAQR